MSRVRPLQAWQGRALGERGGGGARRPGDRPCPSLCPIRECELCAPRARQRCVNKPGATPPSPGRARPASALAAGSGSTCLAPPHPNPARPCPAPPSLASPNAPRARALPEHAPRAARPDRGLSLGSQVRGDALARGGWTCRLCQGTFCSPLSLGNPPRPREAAPGCAGHHRGPQVAQPTCRCMRAGCVRKRGPVPG